MFVCCTGIWTAKVGLYAKMGDSIMNGDFVGSGVVGIRREGEKGRCVVVGKKDPGFLCA